MMSGLRDSNGRIVIDEQRPKQKGFYRQKQNLRKPAVFWISSKIDAEHMRGEIRDSLEEVFSKLSKDFMRRIYNNYCEKISAYRP